MTISDDGPIAAVTGANGYVGSIVVEGLASLGYKVRRLIRHPSSDTDDHFYDLANACSPDAVKDIDVVVHCAYDLSVTSRSEIWETNVFGTRSLFDLVVSNGVRRTIFVSSMSAYAGTRQIYGRAKLESEKDALARGMCVVRPGLVYGPRGGGMVGTLRKLTSLPLIPLVGRRSYQFTVHEDDLRRAILALAISETVPERPLGLAHPEPVQFETLLRTIAREDGHRNPRFLPIPWHPLYWSIRAVECTPIRLPVRADSLLGLVRPARAVPNSDDMKTLGVEFRPFAPSS
jgi:nucleoside-diphosphate-sugar epimerase